MNDSNLDVILSSKLNSLIYFMPKMVWPVNSQLVQIKTKMTHMILMSIDKDKTEWTSDYEVLQFHQMIYLEEWMVQQHHHIRVGKTTAWFSYTIVNS